MKKRVWVPFTLTAALLLAACNSDEESAKVVETEQSTDIVTIENEGITIDSEKAPTRAVTVNQHATEVMLALGLEDSMVGTAYLDDAFMNHYNRHIIKYQYYPKHHHQRNKLLRRKLILFTEVGQVFLVKKNSEAVKNCRR